MFTCESILIYQGVYCCTKVCNLHVLRTIRVVIQPRSSGCCESCCLVIVRLRLVLSNILFLEVCVCICVCVRLGSCVNTSSGEGIVTLYAAPSPFLLNKICLNQIMGDTHQQSFETSITMVIELQDQIMGVLIWSVFPKQ